MVIFLWSILFSMMAILTFLLPLYREVQRGYKILR